MDIFEIKKIIESKSDYDWDEISKEYTPFMMNKAFSFNMNTVLFANEMNKYGIDKKMQMDFYFYAIRKGKYYDKWIKSFKEDDNKVKIIQKYYNINIREALNVYSMLSDDQINELCSITNKGGRK